VGISQAAQKAARAASNAASLTPRQVLAAKMTPQSRALRLRQLQELLTGAGPEGMELRASIAAENRAAAQARAAAREAQAGPVLQEMRARQAGVGEDIPRPRPASPASPVPAAEPDIPGPYPVTMDRAREIFRKVQEEGQDSLAVEDLILIEDLQEGRAVLTNTVTADASPDLTATADATPLDGNLEQSAVEIGEGPDVPRQATNPNLRKGRTKRETKVERLRNLIDQYAGDGASQEAAKPQFVRGVQKSIDALTPEERADLIASYGDDRVARRRLNLIAEMAGDFRRDPNARAAQQVAEAADERAASGTPRSPRTSFMEGVGPGLPSIASRFNELPPSIRAEIVEKLSPEARAILAQDADGASVSPEAVDALMTPVNSGDDLVQELNTLIADPYHNVETADTLRSLVRELPADQRAAAIAAVRRRSAIEAELRNAVQQADPAPQAAASAGQPSLRRPGAMSPEVATNAAVEPPTWLDDELGAMRQAEAAQTQARNAPGMDMDKRLRLHYGDEAVDYLTQQQAAVEALPDSQQKTDALAQLKRVRTNAIRKLPLWLKGEDDMLGAFEPRVDPNAPGFQDTNVGQRRHYDDAVIAFAGGSRPRGAERLNRASDSLSPADRATLADEVVDEFGDDAAAMLPDSGEVSGADLRANNPGGGGRVRGGRLSNERLMGAGQYLFGGRNPLSYGMTAEQVADEILSKGPYQIGTADYDMAREGIVRNIEQFYGGESADDLSNAPAMTSQVSPGEERQFQPGLITTNRITTDSDGNPAYMSEADLPPPARQELIESQVETRVPGRANPWSGVEEYDQRRVEVVRARIAHDRAVRAVAKAENAKNYDPAAVQAARQAARQSADELGAAESAFAQVDSADASRPGLTYNDMANSVSLFEPSPGSLADDLPSTATPASAGVKRFDPKTGEWARSSLGGKPKQPKTVTATVVGSTTNSGQTLPPAGQLALPGPKPLPNQVNLNSSATELGEVSPVADPLATAATGSGGASSAKATRAYTPEEIEDAATEAYGMAYQTAKDEGMGNADAQAVARDAADKVRAEMQASGTLPPADGSTAAPKPEAATKTDPASAPKADGETLDPVADPQANGSSTKSEAADASTKPADDGPTKPAKDGDTPAKKSDSDPSGKDKTPPPKKGWFTWPRALVGAATAGGLIAANMGGRSANVMAGGPIPVPPGGGGVGMDDAAAEMDAIDRALERIRGSRRNDGMPTTQVIQNWTGWR
jgi:hypothetical protein